MSPFKKGLLTSRLDKIAQMPDHDHRIDVCKAHRSAVSRSGIRLRRQKPLGNNTREGGDRLINVIVPDDHQHALAGTLSPEKCKLGVRIHEEVFYRIIARKRQRGALIEFLQYRGVERAARYLDRIGPAINGMF